MSPPATFDRGAKPPTAKEQLRKLVDNKLIVLATLFFVTLFLGWPMLWASRAFSKPAKVFWTLANLLWSAVVFYVFYVVMVSLWAIISQSYQPL